MESTLREYKSRESVFVENTCHTILQPASSEFPNGAIL